MRNRGRLSILVLLLFAAFLIESATALTQVQLSRETSGVTKALPSLPLGAQAALRWANGDFSLKDIQFYLTLFYKKLPGQPRCVWGYAGQGFGPGGQLTLLRLYPEGGEPAWTRWAAGLDGRYPERPDELILPVGRAAAADLHVGQTVTLAAFPEAGESRTFVLTGIYTPCGEGPLFDCALSVPGPETAGRVNFALPLDDNSFAALVGWTAKGPPLIVRNVGPGQRAASVARAVYGSQSTAVDLAAGLVGVAVFVVLLVAFHERRREVATYKMAGLDNTGVAKVLGLELAIALTAALAVGLPAYGLAGVRLTGSWNVPARVHLAVVGRSLASTIGVTALGALYPLALTTVASPRQLLSGERIFIFRRRQTLRDYYSFGPK